MALNTGYAIRTGAYEPAKKNQSLNNNKNDDDVATARSLQEEALARYSAAKVRSVQRFNDK